MSERDVHDLDTRDDTARDDTARDDTARDDRARDDTARDDDITIDLERYPITLTDLEWRYKREMDLRRERPDLTGSAFARVMIRESELRDQARVDRVALRAQRSADARARRDQARADRTAVPLSAHIGRRIAAERIYARRRQRDLAATLGLAQSAVSDIEHGRRKPTAAELVAIADALGCPLDAFIPYDRA